MEKGHHTRLETSGSKTMKSELEKIAPVKVYPTRLQFKDVMENFKYEMVIHARNESKENQKLRVIPPTKPYFKIFLDSKIINIAPGLATKMVVLFYLEQPHTLDQLDEYSDEFYILGNSFKSTVSLIAKRPSFSLSIPKIFNLETLTKNKQAFFSIPLKNTGKGDVEITYFNSSSPSIAFEDQKLIIRKNDSNNLRIKVNFRKTGPIEEIIQLPDGECIKLKGICVDEKVQIYDIEGKKLKIHDLKAVYVGEKVQLPFFVVNNSGNTVECLAKMFPKVIPDYIDIKIDEEKMAFISRQNPKTLIQEENKINIKCQTTRFHINAFEDFSNKLLLLKTPTPKELKAFEDDLIGEDNKLSLVKSIFSKHERQQILPQMTETLYVKVINFERPLKVLVKYTPILPKVRLNVNRFEFGNVERKKNKKATFFVENCAQKLIELKFTKSNIFKIEGSKKISPFSKQKFTINFRPIIYGEYSETIQMSVFGVWKANLRLYGECKSLQSGTQDDEQNLENKQKSQQEGNHQNDERKNNEEKSQDIPKEESKQNKERKSKKQIKEEKKQKEEKKEKEEKEGKEENKQNVPRMMNCISARFLSQQRKKRLEKENRSLLKMKLTQRTRQGFYKYSDLPVDLAFDACENPKVRETKKFEIKTIPTGLFIKSEKGGKTIESRQVNIQNSGRLNIKEVVKCSEQLSIAELSKIQVKGDRIDFGTIFVGSQCQKDLVFCNRNSKPIYIELDMNKSEVISELKGEAKKIEAFGELRCPIIFKSDHLGQFKAPITYIINKQHIFQIDAVANVTLINVDFSEKELRYVFAPSDLCFQKIQSLEVTNQGGASIKFIIIEPQNKSFCVLNKKEQELKPKSATTIRIAYRPQDTSESGTERFDQDKLIIKVIGGAQNVIKVFGSVTEPKINIKESQLMFPEVFISMEMGGKLTLRNLSKIETVAKIQLNSNQLVEVFNFPNDMLAIGPEERKQIPFTFLSNQPKVVRGTINVIVRGGKNFKIPVYINFVFPLVEVVGMDCIELDTVPVMNNRLEKEIVLLNKNKAEIKLETNINDFELNDYSVEFITPHEGVQLAYSHAENKAKGLGMSRFKSTKQMICLEESAFSTNRRIKDNDNLIHRVIYLIPNIPTKLKIKFIPKVAKMYEIKVPLLLHKACRDIYPIQSMITCKAVQPLFYIEPYSLNFENAIISDNEFAHMKTISFVNPHNHQVRWGIEEDSINEMFIFKETKGILSPFETKKIEVYFRPMKEGRFRKKISISSGNFYDGFVELELIGSSVSPKIIFTKNVLILPVVPLDTESKAVISVENEGFETVNISKWKISQNYANTEFKVDFLDGRLLSLAKKKLSIEVSFKSSSPVSLTTNLELYDQFGQKIQIPISVTAENCALTTFPYLQTFSNGQIVKDKDHRLKLQINQNVNPCIRKTASEGCSAISGNFIRKWCSFELNLQFENFPESFIESKGQLFYQLVHRISNGKTGLKKPVFDCEDKISRVKELYNYYASAIDILQSEGAFLNHIRPEHLLNVSDYLIFVMQKNIALQQEEFDDLSKQSWTFLFYQLCKIYVLSNITEKFANKLFIKKEKPDGIRSTIYSEHQILILKFLNQYLNEDRLNSFNDQARIFEIIQKIIEHTFKITLTEELSNLRINADSMMLHEFLVIVSKFLHSHLQELGLAMYLESNDLFTMDHKEFILFFVSLMNNLIHYQNSAVIEFECAVDESCRKKIELENPSKTKGIVYWVKIFGCETFTCETKSIELDKKQKTTLELVYQCRQNAEEEARILLVPIRDEDGFIPGHCLSFLLKNKIITKNVMKQIKYKAKLYEVKSIFVDIEMPDSEYTVKLVQRDHDALGDTSSFYMLSETTKIIKGGKDKCELKIAPIKMNDMKCSIVYISPTNEEFTFQIYVKVDLPSIAQTIKLQPMTIEKQENARICIPFENEKKIQCLKFHRQMKGKKKTTTIPTPIQKKKVLKPIIVELNFLDQSFFTTKQPWVTLDPETPDKNFIEIDALFPKSYRNYTSLLLVRNNELNDIRVYELSVSASLKPKYYNMKIKTQARTTVKQIIPNKLWPCFFNTSTKVEGVTVEHVPGSPQLLVQYRPKWIQKQSMELLVEQNDTFQQHIYRIKFESEKPDSLIIDPIIGSSLFKTTKLISLEGFKLTQKQLQELYIKTTIQRPHNIKILGKTKSLEVELSAGKEQKEFSIKLCSKKTDAFYEMMGKIENRKQVNLGRLDILLNIGEVRDYLLEGINYMSADFKFEIEREVYLSEYIVKQPSEKQKKGFYIRFMPMKELSKTKVFKFYSQNIDYFMQAHFIAKKVEPNYLNTIVTHNIESKSMPILLTNIYDLEGKYRVEWEDIGQTGSHQRFKIDTSEFHLKSKEKILLKITFEPKYIGDRCKAALLMKSDTLPELTYIIEGQSKFECLKETLDIETNDQKKFHERIIFANNFCDKDRFRFEIIPNDSDYRFERGGHYFVEELSPKEKTRLEITRILSKNLTKGDDKIVITKLKDRKVVSEINLNGLIIQKLEEKAFHWCCKARETIFENIILPNNLVVKDIQAQPEILKYLSFSTEEKHNGETKIKFLPLKPIKIKTCSLFLLTDQVKFIIGCNVKVLPPKPDDLIVIRTDQIKQKGVTMFRLTNSQRQPANFRAYLEKGTPQLSVEPSQGLLDPYGKQGTPITVSFMTQIHNKKVEDCLIVETNDMYWIFRVSAFQSKKLPYLKEK